MKRRPIQARVLILAGGLGTRLQRVLPDRPKVLAPVGQHTFLDYLVTVLYAKGFRRFCFLLGYRHQQVEHHLAHVLSPRLPEIELVMTVEPEPLGTGGALKLAAHYCRETFFLVNGDSYLNFSPQKLLDLHRQQQALVTMTALRVPDVSRFGSLQVENGWRLLAFREKARNTGPGLISAGFYIMEPKILDYIPGHRAVSLETEILPDLLKRGETVACLEQDGPFFDIGTEASFQEFVRFAQNWNPFSMELPHER